MSSVDGETSRTLTASSSNHSQIASEINRVTISKDQKEGFGLNILGGIDKQYIPGHNGIFIGRIRRNDLRDLIKEGDCILEVNGQSIEGMTHAQVVALFKEIEDECEFTIQTNAERKITSDFDPAKEELALQNNIVDSTTTALEDGCFTPGLNPADNQSIFSNVSGDYMTPDTSFSEGINSTEPTLLNNRSSDTRGRPQAPPTPGAISQQSATFGDNYSLPSSNVSTVSTVPPSTIGSRTRNSSTSTITYGGVQAGTSALAQQREQWRRIAENGNDEEDGESLAASSLALNEQPASSSGTGTFHPSGQSRRIYSPSPAPSQWLEMIFVGIGAGALSIIAYVGYRRFTRGRWF